MFYEFEIAKAKHAELDAKYTHPREVEGVTVRVPNILDRAVWAVQAVLAHRVTKHKRSNPAGSVVRSPAR